MLVFCVFLLPLSWCVCLGVLHHEGFDECAFLCMCKHGARSEEHFYMAIIISLFLGECCFLVCVCYVCHLCLVVHMSLFFHPFILLCVFVCVCKHTAIRSEECFYIAMIVHLGEPFFMFYGFFIHHVPIYHCCQILWPFLSPSYGLVLVCMLR
jgi:hypothetical protein